MAGKHDRKVFMMMEVKCLIVGALMTNCYIIWDPEKRKGAIVDPGEEAERIVRVVSGLGIDVDQILATHCHFDHIGAVAQVRRETGADFIAHKDDLPFVQDSKITAENWGFDIEQSPDPDQFIDEGDVIHVGGQELRVFHTPGHSPGGVSYYHDNFVLSGDCLFQGSIGRTDFRMGSFEILENSIRTKLYSLPDDTEVLTGHGPTTTIGEEKKFNPFVRA